LPSLLFTCLAQAQGPYHTG